MQSLRLLRLQPFVLALLDLAHLTYPVSVRVEKVRKKPQRKAIDNGNQVDTLRHSARQQPKNIIKPKRVTTKRQGEQNQIQARTNYLNLVCITLSSLHVKCRKNILNHE